MVLSPHVPTLSCLSCLHHIGQGADCPKGPWDVRQNDASESAFEVRRVTYALSNNTTLPYTERKTLEKPIKVAHTVPKTLKTPMNAIETMILKVSAT